MFRAREHSLGGLDFLKTCSGWNGIVFYYLLNQFHLFLVVLESFSFVSFDFLHFTPGSVIASSLLIPWFSKDFPFGGSGGPEKTGYLWCRCLFALGHTLEVLGVTLVFELRWRLISHWPAALSLVASVLRSCLVVWGHLRWQAAWKVYASSSAEI